MIDCTHTFAKLNVSKHTFDEIRGLLKEAAYDHAFIKTDDGEIIDMHGIGLISSENENEKIKEKYNELLYAVARKFPGEDRNQTALRYINEAEAESEKHNDIKCIMA